MTRMTLAISIVASLATSVLYLYVGRVLRRRNVGTEAYRAHMMFIVWWETLGYLGIMGALFMTWYMVHGGVALWAYKAYVDAVLLGLFIALWALQFYLVYLYSGSKRSFGPLAFAYGLFFLATLGLIEWSYQAHPPTAVTDNGWQLIVTPKVDLGFWPGMVFSLILIGPQVLAAGAYGMLFFRTRDPTQRYRIALISGSILVWFGLGLVGSAAQVSQSIGWQLFSRFIGILGGLAILLAYRPPAWIRSRYGVRSIDDSPAPMPEAPLRQASG